MGRVDRGPSFARGLWMAVSVLLTASLVVVAGRQGAAPAGAAEAAAAPVPGLPVELPVPVPPLPELPVPVPPLPALPVPDPQLPVPLPVPLPFTTPPSPEQTRSGAAALEAYRGLGSWIDVYDWTRAFTNGRPRTSPSDVDRMADAGVQTLYIQASKHDAPGDVVEPDLLRPYLDRAAARGLRVVAWYLPTLVDPDRDLRRLKAIAGLPHVDSVAVDIEARDVRDVGERNRRLVQLSRAFRQAQPGRTIGAIVLPPVVLEAISPAYWPGFPYRELAPSYDVWMTMGYWTNRKAASGYRDAERYTRENVERLRANLGQPDAPVHPIGGIGDGTTVADVDGFLRAASTQRAVGGSIYDWRTTRPELWGHLRALRR